MANSIFTDVATFGGAIGGYKPKALYSFEFRERANPSKKSELFLLVPPESYSMDFGYRMQVHKTIGGTSFDWFGGDNPNITIGGSLWSYWIDLLPAPFGNNILGDNVPNVLNDFASNAVNKLANASAKLVSGFFPLNQMSGLDEFFRLKYALYDFFQPETGKNAPRSINSLDGVLPGGPLPGLRFLQDKAVAGLNNLSDIQLIYHDYDDNVHWEVVPSGPFRVQRAQPDSFTARWQISLTGIRDLRRALFFVPAQSKKFNADEAMQEVASTLVALNPVVLLDNFVVQFEEDVSELRKMSFDGFFERYNLELEAYFNNRKQNQKQVQFRSQNAVDIARAAAQQAALLEAQSATDLNDYLAKSALPNPESDIIQSGRSVLLRQISEWILSAQTLSGIDAYTGRRIAEVEGDSGTTVQDLETITEESFSVADTGTGRVQYRESRWIIYTVKPGDNLGKIAVQQLGDYQRFPEIAELNNLSMRDFLLDGMVGKTIKIPERRPTNFNNPENLVYKPFKPDNVDGDVLLEELIGRDIELTEGRDFVFDNSGDLKLTKPIEGFIANVRDATTYPAGTLPLYPDWGVDSEVGDLNNEISKNVMQQKITQAAERDPRVRTAEIPSNAIERVGDRIIYRSMKVTPLVGGRDVEIGGV